MDFDNDMVQRLKNRLGEEIRRLENSSDGTLDGASLPTMPSEEREDHLSGNNSPQVSNINNTQPQHSTDFPGKKDTSDLLEEAFMEIKNEREISQRLREELQKVEQASKFDQEEMIMLQQQVETLRELIDPMKKKICELSLTASFAIEQLAVYRMRDEYQSEQAPLPQPPPPPRRSYDSSVNYPPTGRPPTIDNHHQQTSSRHPQHSSRHHQQASHPPVVPVAVVAPPVAQKTHQQHTDHLMERMRRAFAPPPKETMGLLVNSMVQELRRVMRERGSTLPLERVGDCVYLMGKRKVNLAVSGGKLVVKSGGGHHDFIAFLEKYMSSSSARR